MNNIPIVNLALDTSDVDSYKPVTRAIYHGYRILLVSADCQNLKINRKAIKLADNSNKVEIYAKITSKDLVKISGSSTEKIEVVVRQILKGSGSKRLDAVFLKTPDMFTSEILDNFVLLQKREIVNHICLCSVDLNQLKLVVNKGYLISYVYVNFNPYFWDKPLYDYCQKKHISILASRTCNKKLSKDKKLVKLAKIFNKSVFQITLKWCLQKDVIPVTNTYLEQKQFDETDILNFRLNPQQMAVIDKLNSKKRHFYKKDRF